MEQTRPDAAPRTGRDAQRPRVPAQSRTTASAPASAPPGPPRPPEAARADGDPSARGEHVHGEPGVPRVTSRAQAPAGVLAAPPAVSPSAARPERHSVRAQILEALREALLSGELAQGEVYSAPAIADCYGVSPTPVREAMQQLVSEGAVETVPNRGFRVAEHSPRESAELGEVRELLEIPAVLRLARTLPAGRWDELRPLAEDTLTAAARGDRAAYADADRAFHAALLELTGNAQLVAVADDVLRRAQRGPGQTARGTAELLGEASEHVALLDALQAQDTATAERVMRDHMAPHTGPPRA
ncbi:GntR family transcriptional regulator [Streptomyces sp. HNM0574]|uniref:GntR family transcriptional regulator n=1 Tax=Streptomyces sp. HNM0574 TaxID=2714954 RepID=UPI00146F3F49|nr:GntR family transcriptional regulator [Streptomyces sp. HNM0574]NLU65906.1 GntR family transcriptional regulator [Streptomyces sp. HNM0574]